MVWEDQSKWVDICWGLNPGLVIWSWKVTHLSGSYFSHLKKVGAPLVWLSGKEPSCQHRRCGFNPWILKICWRRNRQLMLLFLPGKSHGHRSLAGCSPWGCKELDMTKHPHMQKRGWFLQCWVTVRFKWYIKEHTLAHLIHPQDRGVQK